jgi:hypothetical protein
MLTWPPPKRTIKTGISSLDRDLPKGYERGSLSLVLGPTASGKTKILQKAVEHALTDGQRVLYIAEDSVDPGWSALSHGNLKFLTSLGPESSSIDYWVDGAPDLLVIENLQAPHPLEGRLLNSEPRLTHVLDVLTQKLNIATLCSISTIAMKSREYESWLKEPMTFATNYALMPMASTVLVPVMDDSGAFGVRIAKSRNVAVNYKKWYF